MDDYDNSGDDGSIEELTGNVSIGNNVEGDLSASSRQAGAGNGGLNGSGVQVPSAPPMQPISEESHVSVILRLEIQDLGVLDIAKDAKESVRWICVESGEVGRPPTFALHISNGLEIEYAPSRGVVSGKLADGTALRYEFGSLNDPQLKGSVSERRQTVTGSSGRLRMVVRFCHCLALRSMQLRKLALQLETSRLPMVHYDILPASLLDSFREVSLDAVLHRNLTVHPDEERDDSNTTEISGVGRGYLDPAGNLRIVFLDGSQLVLDSDGSRLHFQPSKDSSIDVFQLLTGNSASAFLPSVVKKRLERVPEFIRKLRG